MINAKPFTGDYKKGLPANTLNFTSAADEIKVPLAVGRYFFHDRNDNQDHYCTASVINTSNGNIGITAAHCLYGNGFLYSNTAFCPGYNNAVCDFGIKFVIEVALYEETVDFYHDYGMIKFGVNSGKLQDETGYFNWDANQGDDVDVTIFGYPGDGQMDCARNTNVLCKWYGHSNTTDDVRVVPIGLGNGSSGGPWVRDYDENTINSGWVVGTTSVLGDDISSSSKYKYDDFVNLINELS
jgi:V8-like Glu-specific endopeptidase